MAAVAVFVLAAAASGLASGAPAPIGPAPPLSSVGRWFTDATGRVVLMHGFNRVAKSAPFYPAAFGFGDDDAAFLEQEGFTAVRLGVVIEGLMPVPDQVDTSYIDHLAETVDVLANHHIFVLFDVHQDGFAPLFNGNGFPDWMAITDGLPNPPDAVFPLYYAQNPAMQRAFEHFWADSDGPLGVGLQESFLAGVEQVATRFAGNPWVLGYELMNEPWPGAVWQPCVAAAGCADLEQQLLGPFYDKAVAALRAIAPTQLVFVEPFVLFNFGQGPTALPGQGGGRALSAHSYALDVHGEQGVVAYAAAAAERDQAPVLLTEFGATTDPVVLTRLTSEMDAQLLPWLDWTYESMIGDPLDVASPPALAALVRPYPVAVAGTPTQIAFDPATRVFDLAYDTARAGGGRWDRGTLTTVSVPQRQYPDGYRVKVKGARVASHRCAPWLTLRTSLHARTVSVRVLPSRVRCRPRG